MDLFANRSGKEAQRLNIAAARLVSNMVRSTLGPKGMDKMLVGENIIVTNDGATILREMNIDHPIAKMMAEVAQAQEQEVGDGTTSAVILAGELLKRAEQLLDQDIHPITIIEAYSKGHEQAQKILDTLKTEQIDKKAIAITAMTGKSARKEELAELLLEAMKKETVLLAQAHGEQSELIQGIVFESSVKPKKDANIALLNNLESDADARVSIHDPEKLQSLYTIEQEHIRKQVSKLKELGVTTVFCERGMNSLAKELLAQEKITAIERVPAKTFEQLQKVTQAQRRTNAHNLVKEDIGCATITQKNQELHIQSDESSIVTILVRAGSEQARAEAKRALEDAHKDLLALKDKPYVVPGAGETEIALSAQLTEFANKHSGKEKMALEAFAQAFKIIPATLAENAGLDTVEVMSTLTQGLDISTGKNIDALSQGIIEPLAVKQQALRSATDVAIMILRIDDVISEHKS